MNLQDTRAIVTGGTRGIGRATAESLAREGVDVEWVQEDMRTFCRRDAFDLVISLFTSFGYFSDELLEELQREAALTVHIQGEHLRIDHCYIERRLTPLNLYQRTASRAEVEKAVLDYGQAIRDLAASTPEPERPQVVMTAVQSWPGYSRSSRPRSPRSSRATARPPRTSPSTTR